MSLAMLQQRYDNAVENFRKQDAIEAIEQEPDEKLCTADFEDFIKSKLGNDAVITADAYKLILALNDKVITDTACKYLLQV